MDFTLQVFSFSLYPCIRRFSFPGTTTIVGMLQSTGFSCLAKEIGLPIKTEKTVYPTTHLIFLGLEFDTVCFEVRLPHDKFVQLKSEIQKIQKKKSVTLRELQSLIGMLNFACNLISPGRTLLRRLINLTIGLKKPTITEN